MGKLDQKQLPLIFVLGPSGAGKSQLGIWLADDLHLLHMEIDRWPKGDGIDLEGIRAEWNAYYLGGSITPLASLLRSRAAKADRAGTVLTFPGGLVLPPELIEASRVEGIITIILYGSEAECLNAFLAREKGNVRGLDKNFWIQQNSSTYAQFNYPAYAPYRLNAFQHGRRLERAAIVEAVKKRADL